MTITPLPLAGVCLIESVPVCDDRGCYTRTWCLEEFRNLGLDPWYVEDVAEALLRLGAVRGQCGAVVNLATGISRSVRSFVEIAARELNLESARLQFGARPPEWERAANESTSVG